MDRKFSFCDDWFCDVCREKAVLICFKVNGAYDTSDDPVEAGVCLACLREAVKELEEDG
jgi:hypothetical protein